MACNHRGICVLASIVGADCYNKCSRGIVAEEELKSVLCYPCTSYISLLQCSDFVCVCTTVSYRPAFVYRVELENKNWHDKKQILEYVLWSLASGVLNKFIRALAMLASFSILTSFIFELYESMLPFSQEYSVSSFQYFFPSTIHACLFLEHCERLLQLYSRIFFE